jgi:hypothetical protein
MSEGAREKNAPTGITIDLARVGFDAAELERELAMAPRDDYGIRVVARLDCSDSTVTGEVVIERARIVTADFIRTTFQGGVSVRNVEFGEFRIHSARIEGPLLLEKTWADLLALEMVVVDGRVDFPGLVTWHLGLKNSVFNSPVRVAVVTDAVNCQGSDFRAGLDLIARQAEIELDETRFGAPSVIAYFDGLLPDETKLAERPGAAGLSDPPSVVSVRRANLAGLLLSGVDLSRCRFVKAHNLDQLRLEDDVAFARTRFWRTTPRRIISEEAHWRADHGSPRWRAFYEAECKPRNWLLLEDSRLHTSFDPSLVASIYRSLRKGREDAKDEPGAADFYYGEMEMRRHDDTAPRAERAILWLYWLVSGYGLRASRAFAALVAVVVAFAFALDAWGFEPDRSFDHALLVSVQSTTSLLRGISEPLTTAGDWLTTALRLAGPLLFGLMLLSLRGRVKR